jgi:hypothetical protein
MQELSQLLSSGGGGSPMYLYVDGTTVTWAAQPSGLHIKLQNKKTTTKPSDINTMEPYLSYYIQKKSQSVKKTSLSEQDRRVASHNTPTALYADVLKTFDKDIEDLEEDIPNRDNIRRSLLQATYKLDQSTHTKAIEALNNLLNEEMLQKIALSPDFTKLNLEETQQYAAEVGTLLGRAEHANMTHEKNYTDLTAHLQTTVMPQITSKSGGGASTPAPAPAAEAAVAAPAQSSATALAPAAAPAAAPESIREKIDDYLRQNTAHQVALPEGTSADIANLMRDIELLLKIYNDPALLDPVVPAGGGDLWISGAPLVALA